MSEETLRIGLVSFHVDKCQKNSVRGNEELVLAILNSHCDLDLLVFPGWTILSLDELRTVRQRNQNQGTVCLLEVWQDSGGKFSHRGYAIQGKDLLISGTPQIFATSAEIDGRAELMSAFLDEFEGRRKVVVKGRTVRWIICGEVNVLRNIQSENNRVVFRLEKVPELKARFLRILAATDVVVNPTHTIMGNQGKLAKRRVFFSSGNRVFCSTSNYDCSTKKPHNLKAALLRRAIQYCYKNEQEVTGNPLEQEHTNQFILRVHTV